MEKVQSACTLLGLGFAETEHDSLVPLAQGSVSFRKRNIRGQNRQLRPTHIKFDDEGNPLPFQQSSTLDKVIKIIQ